MPVFFRAVSAAEAEDLRACGKLRGPSGTGVEGKYVTTSQANAESFGRRFIKEGWETEVWVVRAEFSDEVVVVDSVDEPEPAGPCIAVYDENCDQIAPGYLANEEALDHVIAVDILQKVAP